MVDTGSLSWGWLRWGCIQVPGACKDPLFLAIILLKIGMNGHLGAVDQVGGSREIVAGVPYKELPVTDANHRLSYLCCFLPEHTMQSQNDLTMD